MLLDIGDAAALAALREVLLADAGSGALQSGAVQDSLVLQYADRLVESLSENAQETWQASGVGLARDESDRWDALSAAVLRSAPIS